jgi:hypothetical protein
MASSNPKRQFRMVDLFSRLFLLGLSFSLVANFQNGISQRALELLATTGQFGLIGC